MGNSRRRQDAEMTVKQLHRLAVLFSPVIPTSIGYLIILKKSLLKNQF